MEPIEAGPSPSAAAVSFSRGPSPAVLESSLQNRTYARFSIFACDPADHVRLSLPQDGSVLDALAERIAVVPTLDNTDDRVPFLGGWIGWIGYEAGAAIEGVASSAPRDLPLPDAEFHLYDAAAVYDHVARRWYAVGVDWPDGTMTHRPPVGQRLMGVRRRLGDALDLLGSNATTTDDANRADISVPTVASDAYLDAFDRAKRYIEAGDTYQINLTRRFSTVTQAAPLELYQRLRQACPAPFAALLPYDDYAIVSASPELFVQLSGDRVVTRPIKGTRPRIGDPTADAASCRDLASSEKDRAELNMIVDLLRNDLGRVCRFGSVHVSEAGTIETHPNVFHRVATINGSLATGATWSDLLKAAFPGGSVTGAPKIRAMQIIDELEPTRRDVYCGSIGYIGLDGTLAMNIAIRTMVQVGSDVHLYAGGAIVADSTAESEWNELLAKASAMRQAVGSGQEAQQSGDKVAM